uniref:FMN hydroxy acid dehydrogenase domain-containing protein n=1 Tax=Megaselia scalaris TaxID=36166 RepID=T1H570_MEGSC
QWTFGPNIDVNDLKQFVQNTKLPVIVKGVLTGAGAVMAKTGGAKGIIVSNHGGRNLDSAPASIEALPEIVEAVGGSMTVMLDSGVRGGPEVFKALALGAKQVFVGSPEILLKSPPAMIKWEDFFSELLNGSNGIIARNFDNSTEETPPTRAIQRIKNSKTKFC